MTGELLFFAGLAAGIASMAAAEMAVVLIHRHNVKQYRRWKREQHQMNKQFAEEIKDCQKKFPWGELK